MSDWGGTEFRVLGSIEAVRNGQKVALGGRRQQATLALLLLQPGNAVDGDRLADELWHGAPPRGAATTIRVYISRLRSALPEAAITRSDAGYRLEVPPEQVDARRFERLLAEGREALANGAAGRAASRIDAALELWRGRAFGSLGDEGVLALEAKRLDELRVLALEERLEAKLQLGHDADLVDELDALVAEHPYRERLWCHLMLALYRAGRQADALATYRRASSRLYDDLGIEPSAELRALEQAILRHEVPHVEPAEGRHNLPVQLTSFIGRKGEITSVRRLLEDARLVTLTGIGGVGKTRLALETARLLVPEFRDGVFFVDIGTIVDPALVEGCIARALELREQPEIATGDLLTSHLRETEFVLLLDNCEHLAAACARVADQLLGSCARLRILATSRVPLGAGGESEYPVPPLSVPAPDVHAKDARRSDAVRLFLERARATRSRSEDDDAIAAAGRICRDLEGLPLAIELAAARTKALSFDEIGERLSDRFRFLVSWRRLSPARHRTLREAMNWSYDLLSAEEQTLLRGISVFAGGFTLDAVSQICEEGDDERALALVERLIDASLVIPDESDGATRYRLLETVRQYAAERLIEAREADAVRGEHARYFLALAEERGPTSSASLLERVHAIAPEDANLLAALRWNGEAGSAEHQLRLATAIWRYWWVRGELAHGRRWLEAVIENESVDGTIRARALEGAAGLAWAAGDVDRAGELAERAGGLLPADGDALVRLGCTTLLAHVATERGDLALAERLHLACFALAEPVDRARGVYASTALAHLNLANVRRALDDLEGAAAGYAEAIEHYGRDEDRYGVALASMYLGFLELERGRLDDAESVLVSSLAVFHEMGFPQYASQCLVAIADILRQRGRNDDAVALLAAASAFWKRAARGHFGIARELHEQAMALTQDELGPDAFDASWSEGYVLTESAAFDLARRALGLPL